MSFGLGLVKGLVGGFTRNIQQEQQARAKDDTRIAELENFIIEASLDPKKRVPQELGNMIKNAKASLDNRGSIDLFGRQGPRLQLDMEDLQAKLAKTTSGFDENNFVYGALKIPIKGQFYDTGSEFTKSATFIQSTNDFFANQKNIDMARVVFGADPLAKKLFMDRLNFYKGLYENAAPSKLLALPNQAEAMNTVNLDKMLSNVAKLGLIDSATDLNIADSTFDEIGKAEKEFKDKINRGYVILPYLDEAQDVNQKSFQPFKMTKENKKALLGIAALNGFTYEQYGEKAIPAYILNYAKNTKTQIPAFSGQTVDIMGDRFEKLGEVYDNIFNSMELYKITKGKEIFLLNNKEQKVFFDKVAELGGDDTGDRIRMIAPLIELSDGDRKAIEDGNKIFNKVDLKKRDKIFFNIMNIKVADFEQKFRASQRTMTQLGELIKLRSVATTSPGFIRWVQDTFGSIIAEGGQIDQLKDVLFGRETLDEAGGGGFKKGTTSESIVQILKNYQKANPGSLEFDLNNLSREQALAIALAADMARAVDANGRLSNQDFEKQLERLGAAGFFTTRGGSMAKLASVYEDFSKQYEAIELVNTVLKASTTGFKNPKEIQILRANQVYMTLKGNLEAGGITESLDNPPKIIDEYISEAYKTKDDMPVTVKEYDNNSKKYFTLDSEGNEKEIDLNSLVKSSPSSKDETTDLKKDVEVKKIDQTTDIKQDTDTADTTGQGYELDQVDIVSGNNRDGLTIRLKGTTENLPGLYIQRDGLLVKK